MEPISHQMMGYDRAITLFSPDGRLLQVEYAKKTVRQGSTAIGIVCQDGVLLVTDKRIIDSLILPESVEKIWQVDSHIGAAASGILSDARVLIDRAQLKAQQNMVTYDHPIDTLSVVKDVCAVKQFFTQSGGLRPFGVSILIALEIIVGTTIPTLTNVHNSYDDMRDRAIEQVQTDINITSVSTPINGSNYDLNFTIKNTGSTTLETTYFDILINGIKNSFTCSKSYLHPENEVWFNVTNLPDIGKGKLKVVTDNGISDYYEYTMT